ncbi:unnamed protein product [Trichogramma brassicae]|uniref:Uncharacterized protein n=1 Tax=Trichogramma brassicae TaxID=86971 RepID=A0A6H5IF66_9HYME|nr:unnamed protein product [Trichogramma brassicae]
MIEIDSVTQFRTRSGGHISRDLHGGISRQHDQHLSAWLLSDHVQTRGQRRVRRRLVRASGPRGPQLRPDTGAVAAAHRPHGRQDVRPVDAEFRQCKTTVTLSKKLPEMMQLCILFIEHVRGSEENTHERGGLLVCRANDSLHHVICGTLACRERLSKIPAKISHRRLRTGHPLHDDTPEHIHLRQCSEHHGLYSPDKIQKIGLLLSTAFHFIIAGKNTADGPESVRPALYEQVRECAVEGTQNRDLHASHGRGLGENRRSTGEDDDAGLHEASPQHDQVLSGYLLLQLRVLLGFRAAPEITRGGRQRDPVSPGLSGEFHFLQSSHSTGLRLRVGVALPRQRHQAHDLLRRVRYLHLVRHAHIQPSRRSRHDDRASRRQVRQSDAQANSRRSTTIIRFEELGRSVYMSNWHELSFGDARSVILVLGWSNRPFRLTAGKLITLSIESFAKVSYTLRIQLNALYVLTRRAFHLRHLHQIFSRVS